MAVFHKLSKYSIIYHFLQFLSFLKRVQIIQKYLSLIRKILLQRAKLIWFCAYQFIWIMKGSWNNQSKPLSENDRYSYLCPLPSIISLESNNSLLESVMMALTFTKEILKNSAPISKPSIKKPTLKPKNSFSILSLNGSFWNLNHFLIDSP